MNPADYERPIDFELCSVCDARPGDFGFEGTRPTPPVDLSLIPQITDRERDIVTHPKRYSRKDFRRAAEKVQRVANLIKWAGLEAQRNRNHDAKQS